MARARSHSAVPARMLCAAAVAVLLCAAAPAAAQSQSVTQLHKQPTRQGFYTYAGVAGKTISKTARITKIATPLTGQVYAQLLYYTKVPPARCCTCFQRCVCVHSIRLAACVTLSLR